MKFRVASYATTNTIYETIMDSYLRPSLEKQGVPHTIFYRKDMGQWKYNVLLQPEVIWTAMKTFPDSNIVWMDSDAVVRYYPSLFEVIPERCDLGIYYMKFEDHYGGVPPGVDMPRPELNTGVIYIKNTPKMILFVEEWMKKSSRRGANHRMIFENMIDEKINDDLSFFLLPRAYAYVCERADGQLPAVQLKDPHIIQFCASAQGKTDLYHLKTFDQEDNDAT